MSKKHQTTRKDICWHAKKQDKSLWDLDTFSLSTLRFAILAISGALFNNAIITCYIMEWQKVYILQMLGPVVIVLSSISFQRKGLKKYPSKELNTSKITGMNHPAVRCADRTCGELSFPKSPRDKRTAAKVDENIQENQLKKHESWHPMVDIRSFIP